MVAGGAGYCVRQIGATIAEVQHAPPGELSRIDPGWRAGRIVEQGRSEQVLGNPQDAYTRELPTAIPHPPLPVHWNNPVRRKNEWERNG
jgi:hypothetical protein